MVKHDQAGFPYQWSGCNRWVWSCAISKEELDRACCAVGAFTDSSACPAIIHRGRSGLGDHPGHALAGRQQEGYGGIVSFRVSGGRSEAWSVTDATRLLSITGNLGNTNTTIMHTASTTHDGKVSERLSHFHLLHD